jgi:hypothetical protein
MNDEQTHEPAQTTPQGEERERLLGLRDEEGGTEIPVPTREDVLRDLEKVAKPKPSQRESSSEQ